MSIGFNTICRLINYKFYPIIELRFTEDDIISIFLKIDDDNEEKKFEIIYR